MMKIIKKSKFLFTVLVALLAVDAMAARTPLEPPERIQEEGKFVSVPSQGVGILFSGVGATIGGFFNFFTIPYGIAMDDDLNTRFIQPIAAGAIGFGEVGYYLGAAPFYGMKYPMFVWPLDFFEWATPTETYSGALAEDPTLPPPVIEGSDIEAEIAREELAESYSTDMDTGVMDDGMSSDMDSEMDSEIDSEMDGDMDSEESMDTGPDAEDAEGMDAPAPAGEVAEPVTDESTDAAAVDEPAVDPAGNPPADAAAPVE